ncbi:hypothetical protein NPIL_128181, partial [Nephila pilipes]
MIRTHIHNKNFAAPLRICIAFSQEEQRIKEISEMRRKIASQLRSTENNIVIQNSLPVFCDDECVSSSSKTANQDPLSVLCDDKKNVTLNMHRLPLLLYLVIIFDEIWNADESGIAISDFENDENDDDVKDPSFAPPDLQCDSSSEEETNEEVSIVPEISIVDSVLEQNIYCHSTGSITPKRFKREKNICKPLLSASSSPSPIDVPNIWTPKIPEHSRRPCWKSLLSEEFNPLPPASSYVENN